MKDSFTAPNVKDQGCVDVPSLKRGGLDVVFVLMCHVVYYVSRYICYATSCICYVTSYVRLQVVYVML